MVLDNLYLTEDLLNSSKTINGLLEQAIVNKDEQIRLLNLTAENLIKNETLLKTQLRKQKLKGFKIAGIGALIITTIILTK